MEIQDSIKSIKHNFLAFRNGVVSDTLRKAGMPYKIIFGLQLPQISQIAREFGQNFELAEALWQDENVRESRLTACYIFPPEVVSKEKALALAESVQTVEEADILAFRLLKRLPFAKELADELQKMDKPLASYCGKALLRNISSL